MTKSCQNPHQLSSISLTVYLDHLMFEFSINLSIALGNRQIPEDVSNTIFLQNLTAS